MNVKHVIIRCDDERKTQLVRSVAFPTQHQSNEMFFDPIPLMHSYIFSDIKDVIAGPEWPTEGGGGHEALPDQIST